YSRQRIDIAQILLIRVVPVVDVLHNWQPALINRLRVELGEPETQALGCAIRHPHPDFIATLDGVLPPVRFFQSDAEDTGNRFASQRSSILLAVLAVRPRWHQT